VYEAWRIGDTHTPMQGKKFSPAEAHQLMKTVGTAVTAARYNGHAYFGVDKGPPRFGRNSILEEPKLKAYFGKKPPYLKTLHENAQRRGEVQETQDQDEEESDGEESGAPSKKKAKARKNAGAAAATGGGEGSGGMVATEDVEEDTLLEDLGSELVRGSRIGPVVAAKIAAATGLKTCGELAAELPLKCASSSWADRATRLTARPERLGWPR